MPRAATPTEDEVAALFAWLLPARIDEFQETLRTEVLEPQGSVWAVLGNERASSPPPARQATASLAFWNLVTGAGDLPQTVSESLLRRAEQLFLDAVKDLDAAQLFLEPMGESEQSLQAVANLLASARPHLLAPSGWQHLLLLLPDSPAGATLRELATEAVGDVPCSVLPSDTDVFLCFEAGGQPLPAVTSTLGRRARDFAELVQRVLTRNDVDWLPLRW